MRLVFSEHAWDDYLYWQKTDPRMIQDTQRTPYTGIGKPEPVNFALKGYWSCWINDEHRIVYRVFDDSILMAQLRHQNG
jgi:toxin YoeB